MQQTKHKIFTLADTHQRSLALLATTHAASTGAVLPLLVLIGGMQSS